MATYWLIATDVQTGKIAPEKCQKAKGNKAKVREMLRNRKRELGEAYIVVAETDGVARLYKSYRQFPGNELE